MLNNVNLEFSGSSAKAEDPDKVDYDNKERIFVALCGDKIYFSIYFLLVRC